MGKPRSSITLTLLLLVFVAILAWTLTAHTGPVPSNSSTASPEQGSESVPAQAQQTPEAEDSAAADLQSTEDRYQEDRRKLAAQLVEVRFATLKRALESTLLDIEPLHAQVKKAYQACIRANPTAQRIGPCSSDGLALLDCYFAVAISETLSQLPDVSRTKLTATNDDWFKETQQEIKTESSTLDASEANPDIALKYGLQTKEIENLFERGNSLMETAKRNREIDPLLCSVLIDHSRLLFAEFKWRTSKFQEAMLSGQPLLK